MKVPEWVKPAAWGVIGGAVAALIIGFAWAGWVTAETATRMVERQAESGEAAVVQALTPLCVANAEQQPDQIPLMRNESMWERDDFVIEAGWVDSVSEEYRTPVARACAEALMKGIKTN